MPKILLLVFSMIILSESYAQRLFFVFGHAEYASAQGKLKDANDQGLGGEVGVGIGMSKTFFTGTIGSTWFKAVNNNPLGSLRYSPVKVGIRRYIFRKNLFVKADAGLANMKYSKADEGNSKFTYGAGVGFKFTGFEVIGDYTGVSGGYGSWLSVKAGFTIGL
ncbi:hypothetical protein HMI54_013529 [Coelomomyces lativittatus]|nr:hypothetical protein HMI54_013529 [Coelomomyces lativittatus]